MKTSKSNYRMEQIMPAGRVIDDQEDSDYGSGAPIWWYLCEEHKSNIMGEVRDTRSEAEEDLARHRARMHSA